MIRRGGYTASATTDVLSGTQFSTLTREIRLRIRARLIGPTSGEAAQTFASGAKALFVLEDSTLTSQVLRQQTGYLGKADGTAATPPTPSGLDDDDIIFDGLVGPGNLILTFPGLPASNGVVWDATSY